ncbi:MAG: NAD(P)-dependent oxidoreductase [Patescibacteria group bacterium]
MSIAKSLRLAGVELEPWESEYLVSALGAGTFSEKHLDVAGNLGDPEVLAVFIYSPITKNVLDRCPHLQLITTLSTGFDHIDLAACRDRGVTVCNVPSYGENTVAEHALALLLALTRKIIPAVNHTRHGDFRLDGLRGTDLSGKTAGVIGTGRIGRHMIAMLKGLNMRVLGYDPHPQPELAAALGFTHVALDQLLKQSDVVTIHCPAIPETHHLLNEARLRLMKSDAYLINTARGSIVDTQALAKVLQEDRLAGVGLDVLEEECIIIEERQLLSAEFHKQCDLRTVLADHILLNHPRVIVTPHNAFNTREALVRILDTTIKNIRAFEASQPINVVS